ncbi:membrane protein [Kitasatospora albolonga]|uniref:hypothetical protein n=1 Tax=Kitasatospora albolonga TaxID=68173 RepID=UPI0031E5B674
MTLATSPPTTSAPDAAPPVGRRQRLVTELRLAAPAISLYVGLKVLGILVFLAMANYADLDWLKDIGNRWDSVHYTKIALHGYGDHLIYGNDGRLVYGVNRQAFFPLYPMLMRWGSWLGVSTTVAGMLVSGVSSLLAAWGLYKVGAHLRDRTTGIMMAGLFAVVPTAHVQWLVYTESLFIALTVWALYSAIRHRWVLAGLICVVAGLSRPTSAAVIGAVGLAAIWALIKRKDGLRPLAAMVLAPLGLLFYLVYLAVRYDKPNAYFLIQDQSWGETFDWGDTTWRNVLESTATMWPQQFQHYITTMVLIALPALVFFMLREKLPLALNAFVLASLPLVLLVHHWPAIIPRYLMPLFPLLLPVAAGLAKTRASTRYTLLITLGAASGWYATWFFWNWATAP